jgi:hypothetical protein
MRTKFQRHSFSRLAPLAAAIALSCSGARAATTIAPGSVDSTDHALRADGTPLRTALAAWHRDAIASVVPPSPNALRRVVVSCEDDGPGSLRAAAAEAASGDTIDLGALRCSGISLETGAIAIGVDTLTIEGNATGTIIDGAGLDRVFVHYGGGTFTLRNVAVRNGQVHATGTHVGIGGCIASAGYLTLDHSRVSECYAAGEGGYGGAVYAYSLLMTHSTLADNLAYGTHPTNGTAAFGGAAFTYQIDLVASTITGNAARHRADPPRSSYDTGGGISVVHGGLVVDSTIDSNVAGTVGGGITTFGSLEIRNSTISGNRAETAIAGGLFVRSPAALTIGNSTVTGNRSHETGGIVFNANATFESTIVAANVADVGVGVDLGSTRTLTIAGANNLLDSVGATIAIPSDTRRDDPGLLPLSNNGGPTRTHALRDDSAAIDTGNNVANLPWDQRGEGYARVIGGAADIGAFELDPSANLAGPLPVPALSSWSAALAATIVAWLGALALRQRRRDAPAVSRVARAQRVSPGRRRERTC